VVASKPICATTGTYFTHTAICIRPPFLLPQPWWGEVKMRLP
jgi:hypothetical protein